MQLLTLISDEKLKENITQSIQGAIEASIVHAHCVEECLNYFDIIPDIEAVIFDLPLSSELVAAVEEKKVHID
jgi:hypothetical protein